MYRIGLYSVLLLGGMLCSQLLPTVSHSLWLRTINTVFLAYIMLEVGLEFTLDKSRLQSYGWDFVVAVVAAMGPWLLCSVYFVWALGIPLADAFLIGCFAAPTSAGILFAMLEAAGMAKTWLFQKARNLAIFDDLATILLLVPLQFMFAGVSWSSLYLLLVMLGLLTMAYTCLHRLRLPVKPVWLLLYSAVLVFLLDLVHQQLDIHLEVLLPAFAAGCVLYYAHQQQEGNASVSFWIDACVKGGFMFLVGCALPALELGDMTWQGALLHVTFITLLSNFGKLFPALCYRQEASWRERLALSIAMFPRGEVGAGVLLMAIGYHLSGDAIVLGVLSLALNLLLTGLFIWAALAINPITTTNKT